MSKPDTSGPPAPDAGFTLAAMRRCQLLRRGDARYDARYDTPQARRYNPRFIMIEARRFVVFGRVQGVGFRFFAHDSARREGLTGWVRNRDDGAVEIEAQGDAEALQRFEMSIRRGPRSGRVDDVLVDLAAVAASRRDFMIEP